MTDRSEPDFRSIFEAAPGLHLVLAPDAPHFTMLAASDARLAATLTTRDATIGRSLFEVFVDANPDNPEPSGVANLRASLEAVLLTREPHQMAVQRYDLRRPDGSWDMRYWSPRNVPVLASGGAVRYIVHFVQDVTDLVLEREATAASERREAELRAVLQSMGDGVYIGTPDGIALVNPVALRQFGYARREALPRRLGALLDEVQMRDARTGNVMPASDHPFMRALAGERVIRDVRLRPRGAGADRVLRCVATPVVVGAATVAAVILQTDVTEQVRFRDDLERALAGSEQARAEAEAARMRSDAVLASIDDPFYLLDRDWRFIFVNDAAEPLLQSTRDRLLGRTLWEAFPGVEGSEFEAPYRDAMRSGQGTSVEAYYAPLGTWFDVRTYPWSGGLMVHFRDIGARKAAEVERERLLEETEASRQELEAANLAKGQFLAVMSHELRTPLNAIGGYAQLLQMEVHGPLTDAQRDSLERIQRSQRHLLGLIAGVLDFSRIESGRVTYHVTSVPVGDAIAEAEALVAPQLRAKGLGYRWSGVAPEVAVQADREKLQQILLNLLSNAVKFTTSRDGVSGRIEVSCEQEAGTGGARVHIRVSDTGSGIDPDKLEKVFEPFVQADQGLTRQHSGVGLGLAISRDLARGMGGDLVAESVCGVGTVLTLTLPAGS